MAKRLDYFDVIKGVAIFMVVMGHVITMCIRDIDNAFIFKFISHTHMPLFFFVCGYFSYKVLRDKDGNIAEEFIQPNLWKRLCQLLIPCVVVGTLWLWYFPHSGLLSPLDSTVSGMLLSPWKNGYWFPWVLFLVLVVYYVFSVLAGVLRTNITIYVTALLTWILLMLGVNSLESDICDLFSLKLVAQFYPIFLVGVFAHRHETFFNKIVENGIAQTVALILGGLSLYVIAYFWEFSFMTEDAVIIVSPLYHICAAIVSVALAKKFCAICSDTKIKNITTYLGRNSLEIYLLHYFFLFPLTSLGWELGNMGLGFTPVFIVSAVVATVIVALVLAVNQIIALSPVLSFLLTGKTLEKKDTK